MNIGAEDEPIEVPVPLHPDEVPAGEPTPQPDPEPVPA
jgi:hypothetical protein